MKKERLFYLDFIRALAVISILVTHYDAVFLYSTQPSQYRFVLWPNICNLYIGDLGVSLFLIVSGAALMYVYQEKLDLKTFYKKRFLGIFPMFWLGYGIAFLFFFWLNGTIPGDPGAPKINMIFSVLGIDSFLGSLFSIQTFYIVGEWFLGFILIFYGIFPLLRKGVNRTPKLLIVVCLAVYAVFVAFSFNEEINRTASRNLFIRLPELLFGMYFVKSNKKVKWYVALPALGVLVLNGFLKPGLPMPLQVTYVGICTFLVLVYLSYFLERPVCVRLCSIVCKYSYPVFIVHHVIILLFTTGKFKMADIFTISPLGSYALFLWCCLIVAICSFLLYKLHDNVMKVLLPKKEKPAVAADSAAKGD